MILFCLTGDDNTVTFSFGSLVDKIKRGLTASAATLRSPRSSNAGLTAQPASSYLPKSGLSSPTKSSTTQRRQAMSDGAAACFSASMQSAARPYSSV